LQYYANRTIRRYPNRHVLAIRTEHFWSDYDNLNQLLRLGGQQGLYNKSDPWHNFPNDTTAASIAVTVRTAVRHEDWRNLPINMTVNAAGIFSLCCALLEAKELQVYLEILERADNLDAAAKLQSKMALLQQCGGGGQDEGFQSLDELGTKCRNGTKG
jgi:hypothetical protein